MHFSLSIRDQANTQNEPPIRMAMAMERERKKLLLIRSIFYINHSFFFRFVGAGSYILIRQFDKNDTSINIRSSCAKKNRGSQRKKNTDFRLINSTKKNQTDEMKKKIFTARAEKKIQPIKKTANTEIQKDFIAQSDVKTEERKNRHDRIEIVGLDHPPSLFSRRRCVDAKIYRVTVDHGCHWMLEWCEAHVCGI